MGQKREDFEKVGITQRRLFPYASPIVTVPRKYPHGSPVQETKRLCVDHRKLNAQSHNVSGNKSSGLIILVDILKMDDMLACLHGSKFFTSLDLKSGYYHINLSPETRHKSAFTTIFRM